MTLFHFVTVTGGMKMCWSRRMQAGLRLPWFDARKSITSILVIIVMVKLTRRVVSRRSCGHGCDRLSRATTADLALKPQSTSPHLSQDMHTNTREEKDILYLVFQSNLACLNALQESIYFNELVRNCSASSAFPSLFSELTSPAPTFSN